MKPKFVVPFLFETPEGVSSPETAPPVETAVAPPAPVASDAPWSSDLPQYFTDEAGRAAADRYLREKHQPYVTQLQQQVADAAPARQLYDELVSNPNETLIEVATELYGAEMAGRFQQLLEAGVQPEAAVEAAAAETTPPAAAPDPRIEEMWAEREAERAAAAYNASLEQAKAQHPSLDEALFAPHIVANEGDFAKALESYKVWEANVAAHFGGEVPPPAAPPVLGVGGNSGVQPQAVQEKYNSLDDALDATLAEMRAKREAPSVVGTV